MLRDGTESVRFGEKAEHHGHEGKAVSFNGYDYFGLLERQF